MSKVKTWYYLNHVTYVIESQRASYASWGWFATKKEVKEHAIRNVTSEINGYMEDIATEQAILKKLEAIKI